ncbi:MAG: phage holin family protein [Prevotella sp.]|nr:phage holin family protein [Prevotella sp.]
MFSSDKNIETIEQLIKCIKDNFSLQKEYVKLDVIEKVVRLVTVILLMSALAILLIAILTYLSIAVIFALAPHVGYPGASCIIAAVYVVLLVLLIVFRKEWIEKPLVKLITKTLME